METVRPTERHLLHFDAHHFGDEPLTVHVAQRDFPIARHTPDTLLQARGTNPILRFFPDSARAAG